MKKVLITGGAGFIGYHLVKRLVAQKGYKITIADNFFRGKNDKDFKELLKNKNVKFVRADLTDPRAWKKLGGGYDQVYHLVGINGTKLFYEIPHEVLRIGLTTTLNALEWFRLHNKKRGAKILYTSSNEAYASGFDLGIIPIPTPETAPLVISDTYNPRWSYGGQKLIGELLFINYARAYNVRMSIVRPHNFYGPRAGYEHAIPQMFGRIEAKEEPFVLYGAQETRSFCYIDDAVEAVQRVMESKKTDNNTYHIGSTSETSIQELAEELFTAANWHPKRMTEHKSPEGSVKRRLADVSKIKKDTGWSAETPLSEGIKKTIEWYRKNPKPAKR
ncbi:NAD(P)-dependent oxidoreductase [Candidatus Parcubacteria bacterium]|nr:MAG: NAD(P)-dependent oxidoreductase [Candidatus Parcubacteria bacterium]